MTMQAPYAKRQALRHGMPNTTMHARRQYKTRKRERERDGDGSSRLARLAAGNMMIPFDAEFLPKASTARFGRVEHILRLVPGTALGTWQEKESPRSQERGQK